MAIMLRLERETLAPYELPGNRLSMNMYDDLSLPWDVSPPVADFPKSKYVKRECDREGVLSNGKTFFGGGEERTLEEVEKGLSTASMVTRWRERNPDLVGTDKDVVTVFVKWEVRRKSCAAVEQQLCFQEGYIKHSIGYYGSLRFYYFDRWIL